jgi:hypothetical protein
MHRAATFALFCLVSPAPALAQPAYVGVSLVGEISRFTTVQIAPPSFVTTMTDGGETLGFGLTAGTALGERWGVELEFVRPGVLEQSSTQRFPVVPVGIPVPPFPIPIVEYDFRAEQRHTTVTAAAWFRQPIGGRAELCYLGGIAFARMTQRNNVSVDPRLALIIPVTEKVIEHTVGPMVGLEARVRLTRQLALTPAIRLMAVAVSGREGWLIRPGVGLQWRF